MNESAATRRTTVMTVMTVIGARPQFVKAAVLSRELSRREGIRELLLHTGQHYDRNMSDVFFEELRIPRPDFRLDVGSGPHGRQTAAMLEAVERILMDVRPDLVLVYGDTNSTLAGALAAAKLRIPVAHVEAGLRSHNRRMPEEINRVLVDHLSDLLLATTEAAADNLAREGIDRRRIHVVGDVMCDAVRTFAEGASPAGWPSDLSLTAGQYVLVTIHRAENTDDEGRLRRLVDSCKKLAECRTVVWPIHPRTLAAVRRAGLLSDLPPELFLIEPVGYVDMLKLERHALLVATDSGGVQKEAFYLGVPCLTLRDETEWTETIELGWNRLVTDDRVSSLPDIVEDWTSVTDRRPVPADVHGGGQAARRIADVLLRTGREPSV